MSFAPGDAALFSHNEVVIGASCQRIWSLLIAAREWPDWYANAHEVRVADGGALRRNSQFSWVTFGIHVQSQVNEHVAPTRLAWRGRADGMTAYHVWRLQPLAQGCHVITEETNNGPAAIALRNTQPDAIHDGHRSWLAQLKATAEKTP